VLWVTQVYVIHRSERFRASPIMLKRARENPKIEFVTDSVVIDAVGSDVVEGVKVKNVKDNSETLIAVAGLFYAVGHTPNTEFLRGTKVVLDADGYIITEPGSTRTTVAGVFAAGDVQDKKYRQAITSAGSGCMAALDANHWLTSGSLH
jgi:thioredoxin reductase (NADPH)